MRLAPIDPQPWRIAELVISLLPLQELEILVASDQLVECASALHLAELLVQRRPLWLGHLRPQPRCSCSYPDNITERSNKSNAKVKRNGAGASGRCGSAWLICGTLTW